MAQMSARPMTPPTTTPPIVPGLTDFELKLAAACVEMVEEEEEVIDEEVALDVLVPLR
jgi:hypothetical protein